VPVGELRVGALRPAIGDLDRPEQLFLEPVGGGLVELLVGGAQRREREPDLVDCLGEGVEQILTAPPARSRKGRYASAPRQRGRPAGCARQPALTVELGLRHGIHDGGGGRSARHLAEAIDEIGFALASLGAAYEQLDEPTADRLEEELFGPVQGRLWPGEAHPRGSSPTGTGLRAARSRRALPAFRRPGAKGFIDHAVNAADEADRNLATLQDSMLAGSRSEMRSCERA